MQETNTPLFETECFGTIITHVKVFPTYIALERQHTRYISLPLHLIASVEAKVAEEKVYEDGFVILRTIDRRGIICIVQSTHADALCAAIRDAQQPYLRASGNTGENETPLALPVVEEV